MGLIANICWLIGATVLAFQNKSIVSFDVEDGGPFYCNKRCFEIIFLKTIGMWMTVCIIFVVFCALFIYGFIKKRSEDLTFPIQQPS